MKNALTIFSLSTLKQLGRARDSALEFAEDGLTWKRHLTETVSWGGPLLLDQRIFPGPDR